MTSIARGDGSALQDILGEGHIWPVIDLSGINAILFYTFLDLVCRAARSDLFTAFFVGVSKRSSESVCRKLLPFTESCGRLMEKEYKRLAEKLCKDKACKIQYCLQGSHPLVGHTSTVYIHSRISRS